VKRIKVVDYFLQVEENLANQGKWSTSRNYRNARISFSSFLNGRKLALCDLDETVVRQYNDYLDQRGLKRNSKSFYNRILRAVYNKAVREQLARPNPWLFTDAYTGVDRTRKKALSPEALRSIMALDLSAEKELAFTRDLFLFSFYARGMSFVDMVWLSRNDVSRGEISYVRRKTGARITVEIEPCMAEILERWQDEAWGGYVFPLLHSRQKEEAYREYVYRLYRHNLLLKEIGRRAGIPFPLNSYAARHSWATLARDSEIPLSVISRGMGHTSERTTQIYLADLSQSVLDQASRTVIRSVLSR
jgi:integrase